MVASDRISAYACKLNFSFVKVPAPFVITKNQRIATQSLDGEDTGGVKRTASTNFRRSRLQNAGSTRSAQFKGRTEWQYARQKFAVFIDRGVIYPFGRFCKRQASGKK